MESNNCRLDRVRGVNELNVIEVDSKQIQFVRYDEAAAELSVHYHTGEVRTFPSGQDEFMALLTATNKYDKLVQLTFLQ
jgi:hypothetical protein